MRKVFGTLIVALGSLMLGGLPVSAAEDGSTPAAGYGTESGTAPQSVQLTGFRSRAVCPCPCPTTTQGMAPAAPGQMPTPAQPGPAVPGPAPGAVAPGQTAPQQPAFEQPAATDLAGSFGAAAGPESALPNMIGDLAYGGSQFSSSSFGPEVVALEFGRFKMAEDNNPIPQDRFFFNYNHFNNALQSIDGRTHNFDRYTFGMEKTFLDERASIEFRLPFGHGLSATQSFATDASLTGTEFGNIPLVFKMLLCRCEHQALSAGMAITFPTARDIHVTDTRGSDILVLENDSVHLDPFIGWLWKPAGRRLFIEAFGQLDFDTNGNHVLAPNGNFQLVNAGRYQLQNLGLLDLKLGYWLIERPEAKWVRGVIPTIELHYTTTLQNTDSVAGLSNPLNRMDILDATAGVQLLVGKCSTLTFAGAAPLKDRGDRLFNGEFMVQFDRRF